MPINKQQLPDELVKDDMRARWWRRQGWLGALAFALLLLISTLIPSIKQAIQGTNLGVVLYILASVILGYVWICFNTWRMYSTPARNFKSSVANAAALNKLIAVHAPYGIYLRDFESEHQYVIEIDMNPHFHLDNVERTLVKQIKRDLPVFAFFNEKDTNDTPIADRIYCEYRDWFDTFVYYANTASLFIINIDALSKVVTKELDWIFQPHLKGRVLLVAPTEVIAAVRTKYPKFDDHHWFVERGPRTVEYGAEKIKASEPVLNFIRSLE